MTIMCGLFYAQLWNGGESGIRSVAVVSVLPYEPLPWRDYHAGAYEHALWHVRL